MHNFIKKLMSYTAEKQKKFLSITKNKGFLTKGEIMEYSTFSEENFIPCFSVLIEDFSSIPSTTRKVLTEVVQLKYFHILGNFLVMYHYQLKLFTFNTKLSWRNIDLYSFLKYYYCGRGEANFTEKKRRKKSTR